jgi:hypothetical protein
MFGVEASMEKSSQMLVIVEFYLFKRSTISQFMCVDPLALGWTHEGSK